MFDVIAVNCRQTADQAAAQGADCKAERAKRFPDLSPLPIYSPAERSDLARIADLCARAEKMLRRAASIADGCASAREWGGL